MAEGPSSGWRARLGRIAGEVLAEVERAGKSIGIGDDDRPYEIMPYRGYGTRSRVLVHGRVIESRNIAAPTERDSLWRNLVNTYKRIDSDPLPHARVHVRSASTSARSSPTRKGSFASGSTSRRRSRATTSGARPTCGSRHRCAKGTRRSRARADPRRDRRRDVRRHQRSRRHRDPVAHHELLQAVRTVMLGNARTRLPFPGVAAFYQALERGGDGKRRNPIFYVSSSPWNIHDVIAEFMDIQRIPTGPIHLRDWDVDLDALTSQRLKRHKEPIIKEILELYPSLPFILIGDDSQKDPEIYRSIIDQFPGRILAIYIRNVRAEPARSTAVQALAKEVLAAGSTLILADDTFAAAKHAAEQGWIEESSLESVHEEKRADEGKTGEKADVPGVPEEPKAPTVVVE
jgi:phosphatidate phosphatase APP1